MLLLQPHQSLIIFFFVTHTSFKMNDKPWLLFQIHQILSFSLIVRRAVETIIWNNCLLCLFVDVKSDSPNSKTVIQYNIINFYLVMSILFWIKYMQHFPNWSLSFNFFGINYTSGYWFFVGWFSSSGVIS